LDKVLLFSKKHGMIAIDKGKHPRVPLPYPITRTMI